uniref:Uncharacterized protein n=1 Tax=Panagrolaimus sp. ES5 TaxID=591445 RepID=A0AC34F8P0_9BILA
MAGQSKCVSTQYNITVKPGSYAHQYDAEIVFYPAAAGRRPRTLTKGGDAFQKTRCRHILKNFDRLNGIVYAYDGQACLWTARALEDGVQKVGFAMDGYMRNSLGEDGEISVSLTYVRSINLSDFSNYVQHVNDANEDRTLRNVLEMILSQNALERDHNQFSGIGAGLLCETAETRFERGFVIRNGSNKGVHVVKSSHGPQPLLAISNSKKVFYPSGANFLIVLQNFMGNQMNYAEAEKAFRGVKLQLRYTPGRTMTFRGFSDMPLSDITFMDDGHEVTIEEYLHQRYEVNIQFPHYKGAVMMQGDAIFPLEQLIIIPDQPVPDNRLPAYLREQSLRINRLAPNQRYAAIAEQFALLEMNNPVTHGFGVSIENDMIKGTFTRLDKIAIIARRDQRLLSNDMGVFKFDKNQYLIPAQVKRLVVLSSDDRTSMPCVRATVAECRRKGTNLPEPEYVRFNTQTRSMNDWYNALVQYKNQRTLVFVVDSGTESHAMIKLAESLTCVPTQHILVKTAEKAGQQYQTLENIAHKVNLKTGGLNHQVDFNHEVLDLNAGNILVIGLDVCHPTGEQRRGETAEPSFVGITGNYLLHPCAFAGTFFAQETRQESVDAEQLYAYTREMLEKASKHRKIDTVVLMRDGVSEGQYNMALTQELAAIQQACEAHFQHGKCKLLGIIVTKTGNVRHFNVSNNRPESLPPRSVITFGTRENYLQFYIVPHRAVQGTAKAVMVTAIRNDYNFNKPQIQKFIMALTSLHQIVCAPISLPEPIYQADKLAQRGQLLFRTYQQPIYQADKLAQRGQLLFRTYQRFYPTEIPREEGPNGPIQFLPLTKLISFNGGNLPNIRFTA